MSQTSESLSAYANMVEECMSPVLAVTAPTSTHFPVHIKLWFVPRPWFLSTLQPSCRSSVGLSPVRPPRPSRIWHLAACSPVFSPARREEPSPLLRVLLAWSFPPVSSRQPATHGAPSLAAVASSYLSSAPTPAAPRPARALLCPRDAPRSRLISVCRGIGDQIRSLRP